MGYAQPAQIPRLLKRYMHNLCENLYVILCSIECGIRIHVLAIHGVFPQIGFREGSVYATLPLPEAGREVVSHRPSAQGTHNHSSKEKQYSSEKKS